jgi:hypothetical protein
MTEAKPILSNGRDEIVQAILEEELDKRHRWWRDEIAAGDADTDNLYTAALVAMKRIAATPAPSPVVGEGEAIKELVRHCWVHSGYRDCGFEQMTTEQKQLYRAITHPAEDLGGPVAEATLKKIADRHEYLEEHGWDVPPRGREHLAGDAKRIRLANASNAHCDRGELLRALSSSEAKPAAP